MAPRTNSPLLAAVLSALVPGLGQWYVGYHRRATALITISAVSVVPFVVAVLVLFGGGPRAAIGLIRPFFDHPAYLIILLAINLAVLAFRVVAALDAFWLAGGGFSRQWFRGAGLAMVLMGLAVAAPHAWAAQRNVALYDLLTFDYSVDPAQVSTTTVAAAPSTTTTTPQTTTTPVPTSLASTTTTTSSTTVVPPLEERRINILLLGGDAGPDRRGIRTDTMIVVSVDPVTGATALLQLPRNQVDLPVPPGHPLYDMSECHCYTELANTIYQYGLQHPEQFPGGSNSGAQAAMDLVGFLFGIEIHQYALVDLLGFVDVIDALGGLTITVTRTVTDELYTRPGGEVVPVDYPPGTYRMDGEEVLAYARVRRGTDDYNRMGRQRCVLGALANQADPVRLITSLPTLVPAIQGSILTDIPVSEWPDFIELADSVRTSEIVSVRFMPNAPELVGTGTAYVAKNPKGYWVPNVELIRSTIATILAADPRQAAESLGIPSLGEVCGTG